MALRERFKNFKGRMEEKARRALGSEDGLARSPGALPDIQIVSSALNTASSSIPGPGAAPPVGGTIGSDQAWASLKDLLQALDKCSGVFRPLEVVINNLVKCIDVHEDVVAVRRDYKELKLELEILFSDLSTHLSGNVPPTMSASMDNLCTAIENEMNRILSKDEGQTGRHRLEARKNMDDVMECYHRIHGHLKRLTFNLDLNAWKIVDEQAAENRLKSLMPSMSACYNSAEAALVRRRECTPKTREEVLAELGNWRHDRNQGNLYWLNGMAGTGKTTITSSLCAILDRAYELGASFFCTRQLPECRNIKLVIPTIAYQLARFSRPFRYALFRVLERDPDVHTRALSNQMDGLIIGPLREVASTLPTHLVVVIDALDECEDSNGVGQMLEMFAKHASKLPVKVFISSRPEPQIRDRIGSMKSQLILHELDKSVVEGDIETYLRAELARMSLSEPQLAALVKRAGVLFIYAATVVRYIGEDDFSLNPKRRLENVLGASVSRPSKKNQEIDELYTLILASALDSPKLEDSEKKELKLVLHTILCAQEPLTIAAIAGLLHLDDADQVQSALRRLWSVLHISRASGFVTTLHASFPDYMLDPERSKKYSFDSDAHNGIFAELCFQRIEQNKSQFNICDLESSYLFDDQVPDLDERVKKAIPLDLAYACQHWAMHLELGGMSDKRMQLLGEFLSTRLLLWMEVLNLKKWMNIGALMLEKARSWCTTNSGPQGLKSLIHDAWRFVTMFAANSVSRSTPHIYISMFPFWPRSKLLADSYIQRTRGLAKIGGTGMTRRQFALLSMFNVNGMTHSIAFSSDGMRIVSGGYHAEPLCVWDARNGQTVLGPLEGHTDIQAAVFSPDCTRVVSASWYGTISLWDAQTGQVVLGPLEGHTKGLGVISVAFSPDGMRIVSGSGDTTICVWDAQTGQMVLGPLAEHAPVNSVAFSPDGMRIVSGSDDTTMRVWDAQTGQTVLELNDAHSPDSVAFSPDGMHIAAGSGDRTIRVWDAQHGQMMLVLEGHFGAICSVAFSPDGMRIVSGSDDHRVIVWDAQNGQVVLGPLERHTDSVCSVAFSPDGLYIVSGSFDGAICVWDTQNVPTVRGPLKGHIGWVNSAAFSPDGMRIVSGSHDTTICVWDAQTGQIVLGPLVEHASSVSSVAFSPDGMRIVSSSSDNTLCVWDAQAGNVILGPLKGHTGLCLSAAFAPDGMQVVSVSCDRTICVWDSQNGQMVLTLEGHTSSVCSVAFSSDGIHIVSSSYDKTIRMWDVRDGQMVLGPLEGHTRPIYSVAFSPDGMRIVSGSADKTICVWDAQNGQMVLGPIEGHTGPVYSVAFSPDGMYFASGSDDRTICVWDARGGQLVMEPLKGHIESVLSVAFSPDSTRIVSCSTDKAIRVWDLRNQQLAANSTPRSPNASFPSVQGHQRFPQNSSSDVASGWTLDEDGWVIDEHKRLCLWVPPDLRGCLMMSNNTFLASPRGYVQLNLDGASIGESWVECYSPA